MTDLRRLQPTETSTIRAGTLDVVVPVYNEEEVLPEFHKRLRAVLDGMEMKSAVLYVNDGSSDRTLATLLDLRRGDPNIAVIDLSRNFGKELALTAGLDHADADAVVIIDADLQDPPELILEMAGKWQEGYEVVYAVRTEREGESWFKLWTASLFYRLIYRITDVKIPLDTGDFRLMDRKVVDVLKQMRERHRFPRGMSAWVGFRQVGVEYKRAARKAGETKYPFRKMFRLALNAITSFSYFPLQVATFFGFASAGIAIIAIPVVVALRLAGSHFFEGQTTTLISVLFLGGVQLISLGILGEYIGRLYDEAKGRPLYIVREAPQDK